MSPETKKFLRNRKLGAILPWIGVIGMIVLTFLLFFSGLPVFLTEIGFIANFYYWIDEYNWIAERIAFDKDHLASKEKEKQTKIVLILMAVIAVITTILLACLLT